ncbi:MAG: hypothetical protein ISS63_07300 [Desulfobacteraceae bacterium]|nr:hypothetical protein [Desulfobacteraceae bacterium]
MASCMLRTLSYSDLKKKLKKQDKIIIYTCGSCVDWMGIGGPKNMDALAEKLKEDGYNVIYQEMNGFACCYDLVAASIMHPVSAPFFQEATVIISLIDDEGSLNIESVFPDKKVIRTCKSIGFATWSPETGNRLSSAWSGISLDIPPEGMTTEDAAQKLGMYASPFV